MWTGHRPHPANWFTRVKARSTFKSMFRDMRPADRTNDLKTFGSRSWLKERRMPEA